MVQKMLCNYVVFRVIFTIHCLLGNKRNYESWGVNVHNLCMIAYIWTYPVYDHIIQMIVIKSFFYLLVTSKNADIA